MAKKKRPARAPRGASDKLIAKAMKLGMDRPAKGMSLGVRQPDPPAKIKTKPPKDTK